MAEKFYDDHIEFRFKHIIIVTHFMYWGIQKLHFHYLVTVCNYEYVGKVPHFNTDCSIGKSLTFITDQIFALFLTAICDFLNPPPPHTANSARVCRIQMSILLSSYIPLLQGS
jgi:hypothetical protein